LYYRLCADVILVPPLRQRIQEDPNELDELVKELHRPRFNRNALVNGLNRSGIGSAEVEYERGNDNECKDQIDEYDPASFTEGFVVSFV
jgi:hypothetical protein